MMDIQIRTFAFQVKDYFKQYFDLKQSFRHQNQELKEVLVIGNCTAKYRLNISIN